ncbi:Uncharacterized protein QTN25_004363 [Entamoeba marina]
MEETTIIERINQQTSSLNQEIKRLLNEYQSEKQRCDELNKSYNDQLQEIERIKTAIQLFERNHQQVDNKIKLAEQEIAQLHARLDNK